MRKFETHWVIFNASISTLLVLWLISYEYSFMRNPKDEPLIFLYVALGDLFVVNVLLYFFCIKNGQLNLRFVVLSILIWSLAIYFFYLFCLFISLTFMGF